MAEVIGVRFKEVGKVYYFDPLDNKLSAGDMVIVETARGLECGKVATPNKTVSDEELAYPLKPLIRIATENDLRHLEENKLKEKEAYRICEQKIANHKLEMKLVSVECTFDNSKILFYFTADGRVDFRALVKDLASVFRTRIELRQIGVRDEAKMLGGLGVCGKPFCCASFMGEFQPVSIKMAKEQGLSLSPVKISGTCGRLMCCLKYEQDAYTDLLKKTPKVGAIVNTPDGKGLVVENNLIARTLKVKLNNTPPEAPAKTFNVKQKSPNASVCSTRLPVSVCGTGAARIKLSGFSREYAYPHYQTPTSGTPYCQVRLKEWICLLLSTPTPFNALFRQRAEVSLLRLHIAPCGSNGMLTVSAIALAVRLRLRTRLTPG